jgi:hypothetical protein
MMNYDTCKTIAYSLFVMAFLLGTSSIVIFDRWIEAEQLASSAEFERVNPDGSLTALSRDYAIEHVEYE